MPTSAAAGSRHSIYLAAEERAELERLADEHATSLSFVVRVALRLLVGLPVPSEFERVGQEARQRVAAR